MRTKCEALIVWMVAASIATAETHWAFQPVERPAVPAHVEDPVSWLVAQSPLHSGPGPVERRVWVRRLSYNLTGLPPSHSQLQSLLASEESDGVLAKRLVDELLRSPRYGERWARLWLDVARYSDTKGYAYSPEEFNFPHAWVYRDWVIAAFNEDLPYDRFIERQLAADLLLERGHCDRSDLAAMGFLTLGRRFIGVEPDIIDDRIDVVTRGILGLTVACARCHDHKFDPIPTADYYALYGMFKSSREDLVALDPDRAREQAELLAKKAALADEFEKQATALEERLLKRAGEYMLAARDISSVPPPDFAEVIEADDLNPAQIRRWYEFLSQESRREDAVFGPWLRFVELEEVSFKEQAPRVLDALEKSAHPLVLQTLRATELNAIEDVANCYARLFSRAVESDGDSEWAELRAVVFSPGSPLHVSRDYIHDVEWLFTEQTKVALKKRLAEVERAVLAAGEEAPHALILADRERPLNVRVFERGQYPNQLGEVLRGSPSVLHGGRRQPFQNGSGRLEFARALTAEENPLTARVLVNRVWRAHFGEGLVRTDSDFGLRSEPPAYPEVLDYLASELIASGWSIKHLQRLIATSAIYRSNFVPRRRLDVEAMRDTLLAASGELDLRMGGPPGKLFGRDASTRRSIYGRIDRQFLPSTLRVFDFANPELHTPRRYETNVPQQALFLMNAPFTLQRARSLAERVEHDAPGGDDECRVAQLFRSVYGRDPVARELAASLQFIRASGGESVEEAVDDSASLAWAYGYGQFSEELGGVAGFQALPHFDGKAWGGGSNWPDERLGWVRLTARGGHAGNTTSHAAVRRWTAPIKGTFKISGEIAKVEDCGDGIRAWITSDRQGVLGMCEVSFGSPSEIEIPALTVEAGEVIDFVVDCGEVNNFSCDGFAWAPRIEAEEDGGWDAAADFAGVRTDREELDAWARLAHALLISNEAMFLD